MGNLIYFTGYRETKNTKGDKMYREFLRDIRRKPIEIENMPDRAQDVLNYFQVSDFTSGVPIVEILTKLGFQIYQGNLEPEGLSAYIAVDPKFSDTYGANKITCVHIKDNIGHKRFALAHELAHYLFDFNEGESLYYYDTYFPEKEDDKVEERRANKFAACLLMPEKEFRQVFEKYKKLQSKVDIVSSLSQYFLVSSTAVLRRFCELNITGFENNI